MRTFDTSPEADPDADSGSQPPAGRLSPFRLLFRVIAGLVIAASFGVWVYAYSGLAKRDTPDLLSDRRLVDSATTICSAAVAEVAAMPNALDATDGSERAVQIRQATDRFEVMVGELEGLDTVDERDNRIYRSWLGDWRVILKDRRDYADRITVDPDAQFYITDTGVSERLDKRITRFANTNLMTSCAAPTDV